MVAENPSLPLHRRAWLLKAAVFLAFCVALVWFLRETPTGNLFLSDAGRKELVASLDARVKSAGIFGPILFVIAYTIGTLALPATPFTVAGAFIFGKWFGFLLNFAADIASASIAFLLGRYLLRDFARHFLTGKLADLDRRLGVHGFTVVLYLRLLWFPFIVLNYAAGATRIRFRDFFWGTFLGIIPGAFVFTYFFGSLKEIIASVSGWRDIFQFDVIFPMVLLVGSFFVPFVLKRLGKSKAVPMPDDVPL